MRPRLFVFWTLCESWPCSCRRSACPRPRNWPRPRPCLISAPQPRPCEAARSCSSRTSASSPAVPAFKCAAATAPSGWPRTLFGSPCWNSPTRRHPTRRHGDTGTRRESLKVNSPRLRVTQSPRHPLPVSSRHRRASTSSSPSPVPTPTRARSPLIAWTPTSPTSDAPRLPAARAAWPGVRSLKGVPR